jgi:hypothetical protein
MATSEKYLKEHNIHSVSLMSEGTMAPRLLVKIDSEVLSVELPQGSVSNLSDVDRLLENTVQEYEWKKKIKERVPKLSRIINGLNK